MKTKYTSLTRKIMPGLIIILTVIILVGMLGISPTAASPDTSYKAVGLEPNPLLNVNATWSTFYSSWQPLEYNNGTANKTLNAGLSNYYKNPITVNPTDIISQELQGKVAGVQWKNTTNWENGISNTSIISDTITNTSTSLTISSTTTGATSGYVIRTLNTQFANFPSANLQYDYFTLIVKTTSTASIINPSIIYIHPATGNGTSKWLSANINGETAKGSTTNGTITNGIEYFTINLEKMEMSGTGVNIYIEQNLPAESDTITTTIYGMALTEMPYILGDFTNSTGTHQATGSTGDIQLSSFNPNFVYSEVSNNGYSVALSQSLQNIHISQSSINNANYIEQATYQGSLGMPSEPDLTYGNANITMPINVPGKQFQVFTIGGQSYISNINDKLNGTFILGGVNPENGNTIIIEVEYTASQWDKISSPPSFWTDPIQTIEYYWYVALGAALGIIGLGAGIKSHSNSDRVIKR